MAGIINPTPNPTPAPVSFSSTLTTPATDPSQLPPGTIQSTKPDGTVSTTTMQPATVPRDVSSTFSQPLPANTATNSYTTNNGLSVNGSNPWASESSSTQGADFLKNRAQDSVWFEMGSDGKPIWHMPGATGTGASTGPAGGGIVTGDTGSASASSGYTPWTVTPDQTVEGRINSIINGVVGTQARTQAEDQMNDRGLQNSDLAISAGENAAYNAAIPIATADASTFAKAAGYNSDIQNQMTMQGNQLASAQEIARMQAETQKYGYDVSAQTQKYTADLNAQTQQLLTGLDNQNKIVLQGMQNQNSLLIQSNSQAATIWNQAVAAISQIQNNDKMDATSKTQAISQILQGTNSQLSSMSKASGVNNTLNLANYPGFDASGNYIGFPTDTGSTGANSTNTTNPFDGVVVNTQ